MQAKISTSAQKSGNVRFAIKFNLKDSGLDWNKNDIIRVITNRSKNELVFEKVSKMHSKQVARTLTSTGSGSFAFDKGVYITHRDNRFEGTPVAGVVDFAKCKIENQRVKMKMPASMFA